MLDLLPHMNDKDKQSNCFFLFWDFPWAQFDWQVYGCIGVHLVWVHFSETSLQIQNSNNADVLLDWIVDLNYLTLYHVFKQLLCTYASFCDKTEVRFGIYIQAGHFGIWFVQIRQIEVDINQLNILGLERIYLSGCSQFEQVGTGQNWFLCLSSRQYQE